MSIINMNATEETLRNAVIKEIGNGNISDAFMFYNKLDKEYPSEDNKLLLSEMYASIDEYDYSNNELVKLYAQTGDEDYLKQMIDNTHEKGDLVSLVRYLGVFPNLDYLDFIFQYASEIEEISEPKPIKVVYPINESDAVEIVEMARRENRNGNYALSNEILDKHSLKHSVLYDNVVYLKTDNFTKLSDFDSIIKLAESLKGTANERNGFLIGFYAYCMTEKYDEASNFLDSYIKLNQMLNKDSNYMVNKLNEEFVELVTTNIIESTYSKEKYILLERLFDEFKLNSKFTYQNVVIKYLLGKKIDAYKLLNYIENIYGKNCFGYVIAKMFDQNISVVSLDAFTMLINNYVISVLLNLEKTIKTGDINFARELILNDKQTNEVVRYILTGVKAKNYNKLSDILFVLYNKEIGKFIRELLINNFIYDDAKEPLVKIMIDKDSDKNIDLVLSNVYMKVDFTYPLDEIINSEYNGYYNMLLFVLQKSYRLQDDIYTVQKNLKDLHKRVVEKNIDIKACSNDILTLLLYNGIKGIMIDIKTLFSYYNVDMNMFAKWKTLIYGSEK